jgi:large subunit ribosomal protein L30
MPSPRKPAAGSKGAAKPRAAAAARKPARHATAPKPADASSAAPPATGTKGRAPRVRKPGGPTITIEQYASGIACPVRQKRVLRALGLRHPHHRVVRPDNPAVRGMVKAIPHLVRIEEAERGA